MLYVFGVTAVRRMFAPRRRRDRPSRPVRHCPAPPVSDLAPPYGPRTPLLRHFLRRLATQPPVVWLAAARHYERARDASAHRRADHALAAAVAALGREAARDALVGPVVQMARRAAAAHGPADEQDVERLAEPALAATLALLVSDTLPAAHVAQLYGAFDGAIPLAELARYAEVPPAP